MWTHATALETGIVVIQSTRSSMMHPSLCRSSLYSLTILFDSAAQEQMFRPAPAETGPPTNCSILTKLRPQ